ncbi:hypothetical protein ACWEOO_24945 [Kribbella sp. NPDC004138]
MSYLARRGAGRVLVDELEVEVLRAVVRHRRWLVTDRKAAQQRLHGQLNNLVPGRSAPAGHAGYGRSLAVNACPGWPARAFTCTAVSDEAA